MYGYALDLVKVSIKTPPISPVYFALLTSDCYQTASEHNNNNISYFCSSPLAAISCSKCWTTVQSPSQQTWDAGPTSRVFWDAVPTLAKISSSPGHIISAKLGNQLIQEFRTPAGLVSSAYPDWINQGLYRPISCRTCFIPRGYTGWHREATQQTQDVESVLV